MQFLFYSLLQPFRTPYDTVMCMVHSHECLGNKDLLNSFPRLPGVSRRYLRGSLMAGWGGGGAKMAEEEKGRTGLADSSPIDPSTLFYLELVLYIIMG